MTTKTKQGIIDRYNGLLDRYFAAATIPETNRIQGAMGEIYWKLHKLGYHFEWNDKYVSDIIPYSA